MADEKKEEKHTFSKEQLATIAKQCEAQAQFFSFQEGEASLKAAAYADARIKAEQGVKWAVDEYRKQYPEDVVNDEKDAAK